MAKSLNSKYLKRVVFPSGEQHNFLLKAINKLDISWFSFADKISVHKRTLNDWRREQYSLPIDIFYKICKIAELKKPKNTKIKDPFWYINKGAKLGGVACIKKHGCVGGDPEYRKKKWRAWWEKKGKFIDNPIFKRKPIKKPRFSNRLAEFSGIMIGDGSITRRQIMITVNSKDDKQYSSFIKNLIQKTFDVPVPICYYKNKSAMKLVVSRSNLVDFCNKKLGLRIGHKLRQGLDIPDWIKANSSFRKACLRGLVDTDGCIFNECHKIKDKKYCYPRLVFTSYSRQLCLSVMKILKELNFTPKLRVDRNVQLEKREDIIRYFQLIGTSNPKHKMRFKSYLEGWLSGSKRWF